MLMLRGYVDESHDGKGDLFSLSVILSSGATWFWIEREWLRVIERKNRELSIQGRPAISRYHAADCSSRRAQFADWSVEEQVKFIKELLPVLTTIDRCDAYGYTLSLKQLVREIPETAPNPRAFAYMILLQMLMHTIGRCTLATHPDAIIGIVHERCAYDGVLAAAFNSMLSDETFQYRNRFTSLSPMGWQDSIPLQAADLIAYEHFKESERHLQQLARGRRKSLEALLADEPVLLGGHLGGFGIEVYQELRRQTDSLDQETKRALFSIAGINLP